jgi:hypothetical protein
VRRASELPRSAAWLAGAALVAALAPACGRTDEAGLSPVESGEELPTFVVPAKRPSVRFYIERTSDRCSVYAVDGADKSAPEDAPCPEDMLLGERIRIVGMTCLRESATPDRNLPVVCPTHLLAFERAYDKALASSASSAPAAPPAASSARTR